MVPVGLPVRLIFILLIIFSSSKPGWSGTTGKIAGKVIDAETREALIGAAVIVKGTNIGTTTDGNGEYILINIQPGIYEIQVKYLGYADLTVRKVVVRIDRTTRIDAELQPGSLEMAEVIVTAKKPPVEKDRTYSSVVLNAENISNLPVTEVSEVITLQPGVVKSGGALHFRGGREREVAYVIDGIPVSNSFSQSGGSNVDIENSMISQLEVIAGTFNAEYGSAQSGVINIVTKDIAPKTTGSISVYSGDYLSSRNDVFSSIGTFNPVAERDIQMSLNLPIINEKLGFSLNARYNHRGSLYWYKRRFTSLDGWKIAAYQQWYSEFFGAEANETQAIPIPDSLITGDNSTGPLSVVDEFAFNTKINYSPFSDIKLSYQVFGSYETQDGRSDLSRQYAPDNMGQGKYYSINQFLTFRQVLSEYFFYNLRLSYQFNDGEYWYLKNNKVAGYPGDSGIQPISASSDGFSLGTTDGFYTDKEGKNGRHQFLVNGDFNWQVDNYNFLKGGFEYKRHSVNTYSWGYIETQEWKNNKWLPSDFYEGSSPDFQSYWEDMIYYWQNWESTFNTSRYRRVDESEYALWRDYTIEPYEFSAYLQDKVELGEIILNAGLRLDMFFPNSKVPKNYRVEATQVGSEANLEDAENVVNLSPRFGVSFPISESGVFHAAYGHFTQMPSFEKMYNEPLFVLTPIQLDGRTLGNANLKPEKTIQYELGLQQEIISGLSLDVSVYYKDIRNLLGVEYQTTVDNVRYLRYINRDYGNGKGFTVGLRYTAGDLVTGTLNYSYATANGSSSSPEEIEVFQSATQIGGDPVEFLDRQIIPLDWDQTHTLNAVLNFRFENELNINLVGSLWSGQPYSPTFVDRFDILEVEYKNSDRKPIQWNVDLKASQPVTFGQDYRAVIYLKIDNLFDNLNQDNVYSSTGRADANARLPENLELEKQRLDQAGLFTLNDIDSRPSWYSSPRVIQLGLEFHF